jgi:signal transduction histidine kinase
MGEEEDTESRGDSQRSHTDESLRAERDRADAGVAAKRDAVEEEADEVVRTAREVADRVVQTARDDADREAPPQSTAAEATVERERTEADVLLDDERSDADAALKRERAERARYMAGFLAAEREATDKDLIRERDYADTAVATRDEFLAAVSHDLRSLLCGLSLNAELLVRLAPEGAGGDKMRKHAVMSQRGVAQMNRLVNDLLDIASIEAGKLALLPEQVEIGKIVRDTLDAFEPIAATKRIALDADAAALPLHASLDGARISQVLANLVGNAIKFTPPEGRVSIRVCAETKEIQFAVSDTGIGIAEDSLEEVFERFRQVTRDRRGLGLGLHISKCIIEAHGGRMWVESKLAVGSTFHFAVPAAR